jgi:hypothetical protein
LKVLKQKQEKNKAALRKLANGKVSLEQALLMKCCSMGSDAMSEMNRGSSPEHDELAKSVPESTQKTRTIESMPLRPSSQIHHRRFDS